mmetsp:Transcript_7749/g.7207  ORF Transcript_7749/g.7207 Transcript_7749/m.7207 type:complete len:139 (-) Transcript_7749:830-1246(-)
MSSGEQASFEECHLVWTSWRKQYITDQLVKFDDYFDENAPQEHIKKLYARLEDNHHLANKKGLLINLQEFYKIQNKCVFESKIFPQTFLIREGFHDKEYQNFLEFHQKNPNQIYILKPGENSNRGCGIVLCDSLSEIT